jgi:hypothetical protein
MARLPSAEALGGLPSAGSGRQISSIDGSAVGQGMQTMARGMQAYAGGLDAQGVGISRGAQGIARGIEALGQSFKVDDDLADAQNRADFMSEKIKLDSEIGTIADPSKFGEIAPRYQELAQKYAQKYGDPRRKQKFLIDTQDDVARSLANAGNRKVGIERDMQLGSGIERLERIKNDALKATDEGSKAKLIDAGKSIYDEMARSGLIDYSKAATAKQRWVKDYAISDFRMKSPEQQIVALRGNDGALMMRESGGRAGIENDNGFVGLYQFGAPRLQTLGVYAPGGSENLEGWNKSSKTALGKWSGSFNIPGFPNVRTKAEFLANPDAQETVYQLHQAKIGQEIKSNGLEQYIGKTVGGVAITEAGIRNMIHLGGAGGAKLFLTSNGVINRSDRNGTTLADYAEMGAKSAPSKMTAFLDPDERVQLDREAFGNVMRKGHAAEQEERQFAAVQQAQRNAVVDDLDIGLREDRYGPAEVMQAREAGLLTDPAAYGRIEKQLKDQGERQERANLISGVMTGAIPFNPTDSKQVQGVEDFVDRTARLTGRPKEEVSYEVYNQTGVMPKSGVQAMRGLILQNTTDSIMAVGTMAAKAMYEPSARFPNGNGRVFDGFDGGKEVSEIGTLFKHYSSLLGAEGAAKRIAEMKSPDFKSPVKMGEKEEQEFVKAIKEGAAKDMGNAALFGSGRVFDNKMVPGELKTQMLEDYASEALYFYKKHGDEGAAKQFAMDAVKKVYGVSNGFIQKFPVEKAYENFQIGKGGTDWVYEQAIDRLKKDGITAKKEDVFFTEVPMATADAFRAGREVPYHVHYFTERNGFRVLERLPNAVMPNATKAYTEHLAKITAEAAATRTGNRQLFGLQTPSVDNGGINPRKPNPGRPMKTPAEIEAERADLTQRGADLRGATERSRAGGFGTTEERNQRITEGVKKARAAGETRPSLPIITDAIQSTPPLKDAMPKFKLGASRSRLPGGEK